MEDCVDLNGPLLVAVAKLFVTPGHELDKVVIESSASPTIKSRMDVAVKVSRGN